MTTPIQISNEAREAANNETWNYSDKEIYEQGHFVQQLLNTALAEANKEIERLKKELELPNQLLDVHAICNQRDLVVAERDSLRAQLNEANKRLEHNVAIMQKNKHP